VQKKSKIEKALQRKYPEQVVLVTTRGLQGEPNVMAVGWVTIASSDPWMFVLGIDSGAYTFELIKKTKEFVVAFPHEGMGPQVLYVGTHHGRGCNKLSEAGIPTQKASKVRAPLIADAVSNFECRLVKIVQPGNCPLVVGEIVAAHVNEYKCLRRLYTVAPNHVLAGVRRFPLEDT
jgi:flavin reductase (DIM6/NTAB) family NADH-FMN oxidoreductase RutF